MSVPKDFIIDVQLEFGELKELIDFLSPIYDNSTSEDDDPLMTAYEKLVQMMDITITRKDI